MENNIDKLFKNKLLQHQEQPSEQAWKKLEEAMYGKQTKQRSLGVYWKVAAAVALLLVASVFYFGNREKENLSAKLKNTPSQQPKQYKKEEAKNLNIEKQNTEIEEVKTYQPTKYLAKSTQVKSQAAKSTKVTNEVLISQTTGKLEAKPAKEEILIASNSIVKEETGNPQESEEQEIRITVKFADETTEPQEIGQGNGTVAKSKKSWLGKVVANMKKKRQEEQARDGGENQEKASFSVFGIDTEKVFAKKKMAE